MDLEEILERVIQKGVEMWDITSLTDPLIFSGVMIDDSEIAKELKRMNIKDKKGLESLYARLNANLFVIEKYTGKPRPASFDIMIYMNGKSLYLKDMLVAREYLLSKSKNGTLTFKKIEEYPEYMYRSYAKLIDRKGTGCYHEQACPVSYLDNWCSSNSSV